MGFIVRANLFVGLAVTLVVGALAATPKKSPSSLRNVATVVRFEHLHERVLSCKNPPDGATCRSRRAPAKAGTTLTLTPIANQLVSEPEQGRTPQVVSLPDREGQSTQEARVEPGAWLLSWADQRVAFQVEGQRNFNVQLMTSTGACVFDRGQCQHHDETVVRSVMIPPEYLGTH